MTDHPWAIQALDLDGYLTRLGVSERPPSREALDELHEAHVRTFTFDNIDVLLGAHPGVGLDAVQGKFVGRGRGGYCFEHATLFAAAAERLGYDVRRHLGRVGDPGAAPRTHFVVEIVLDGQRLLADPGFGMSVLHPIVLEDGVEEDQGGWRYRVQRAAGDEVAWEMHRLRDGGWELMHTSDELPVRPVDVVMGHHYTSTFPASHFRSTLMVTRHLDGRHLTLTADAVTVRRPGEPTEHRPIREGEHADLLEELAVPLTDDERSRLLDVVAGIRSEAR
jgi:N-hydroxyarylamine O-acetyltransferase